MIDDTSEVETINAVFYGSYPKYENKEQTISYPLSKVNRVANKYRYDILVTEDLEWYYFCSTDNPALLEDLFEYCEDVKEGYQVIDTKNNTLVTERKFFEKC